MPSALSPKVVTLIMENPFFKELLRLLTATSINHEVLDTN